MEKNFSLLQRYEPWIWNDDTFCGHADAALLPLECYFQLANSCPVPRSQMPTTDLTDRTKNAAALDSRFISFLIGNQNQTSASVSKLNRMRNRRNADVFQAAAMEFLFSRVSPALVREAESAAGQVFGPGGIPKSLIAVHIRWGDKATEMELVPLEDYIASIRYLESSFQIKSPVSIFLTSESEIAVNEMRLAVASRPELRHWALYTLESAHFDMKLKEKPGNRDKGHYTMMQLNALMNKSLGRHSLVALLIALEADYFVLTTASNWSRLINELRLNVVDPSKRLSGVCKQLPCTHMTDLRRTSRRGDGRYLIKLT